MVPTAPRLHHRTFEDHVRDRTDRHVQPYDLRRCFARWMESAGIPRIRRKMYMGHATGDVTELYERHELEAYLAADAAKLREWAGVSETTTHALKLERAQ
jgi:integrase